MQVTWKIDTTELRDNYVYYVIYKTAGNLVFRTVGPLVTLLVLNVFLIRALHDARRRHQQLASSSTTSAAGGGAAATSASKKQRRNSSRNRENITLMLVAVVSVFIVCQLPDLGLRIGVAVVGRKSGGSSGLRLPTGRAVPRTPRPGVAPSLGGVGVGVGAGGAATDDEDFTRYVNSITNVLMALNSAVNFLIYCLVGKKFRRIFVEMFLCGGGRRCCFCCRRCVAAAVGGPESTVATAATLGPAEFGHVVTATTPVPRRGRQLSSTAAMSICRQPPRRRSGDGQCDVDVGDGIERKPPRGAVVIESSGSRVTALAMPVERGDADGRTSAEIERTSSGDTTAADSIGIGQRQQPV